MTPVVFAAGCAPSPETGVDSTFTTIPSFLGGCGACLFPFVQPEVLWPLCLVKRGINGLFVNGNRRALPAA